MALMHVLSMHVGPSGDGLSTDAYTATNQQFCEKIVFAVSIIFFLCIYELAVNKISKLTRCQLWSTTKTIDCR